MLVSNSISSALAAPRASSFNLMGNRKERRAAASAKAITTAADIPLAKAHRSTPQARTLYEIAAERQANLQKGQPFTQYQNDGSLEPELVTKVINSDGSISELNPEEISEDLIGPLGNAVLFAITFSMLHFTLDVLVHQQYKTEIDWWSISTRILTVFPTMVLLLYIFHPRASEAWAQAMFFAGSVAAGCYLTYTSNKEGYYAVMKRSPPLGTLWMWSVVEMKKEVALLSVIFVGGYFWYGDYTIF